MFEWSEKDAAATAIAMFQQARVKANFDLNKAERMVNEWCAQDRRFDHCKGRNIGKAVTSFLTGDRQALRKIGLEE